MQLATAVAANNTVGATSSYTFSGQVGGGNTNLPAGDATIRITYPAGFDVTGATFSAGASGVREGTVAAYNAFPSYGSVTINAGARQIFLNNVNYATTQNSTMFRVVVDGVVNRTSSGAASIPFQILNPANGVNTNGNPSVTLANGPVDAFSVTDTSFAAIASQNAGQSFDVAIRALDQFGNLVNGTGGGPSFTGTVDATSNVDGSAGLTTTAAFTAGVLASHAVTLTEANPAATLTATATSGPGSGTSAPFAVLAGTAAALIVSEQPTDAQVGDEIAAAPAVSVTDAYGNVLTGDSGRAVTVTLQNASGATLDGTTSQNSASGIATFAGLDIDEAGTGYVLRFASAGLTSVDSQAFDVSAPAAAIVADDPEASDDGFTFTIENYDPANYVYTFAATNGATVTVDADGLVTVSGLDRGESSTVTVTATARAGSAFFGATTTTVTGTAAAAVDPEVPVVAEPVSARGPVGLGLESTTGTAGATAAAAVPVTVVVVAPKNAEPARPVAVTVTVELSPRSSPETVTRPSASTVTVAPLVAANV